MATETFRIRIGKDHLVFSCGHFISYAGHQCEKLHGHNYRAAIEVVGPLDQDFCVFDFLALKRHAKAITDELDHHMLLATKNAIIPIAATSEKVHVTYKDREWVFPRDNCILLPIENTTAELLAQYIAGRLLESLKREHNFAPQLMRVEVEENVGMSGTYEYRR